MNVKYKIKKLTIGVLSVGLALVGLQGTVKEANAENIIVAKTSMQDVKVDVAEVNGKAVATVKATKDVKNVEILMTINGVTKTYTVGDLKTDEIATVEELLVKSEVKTLPKTNAVKEVKQLVNKKEVVEGVLSGHTVKVTVKYQVEEPVKVGDIVKVEVKETKEETPAVTPAKEAKPKLEENKSAVEESKEEAQPKPEENKPAAEESKEETPVVEAPEEVQPKPEENKPTAEESKEEAPVVEAPEEAKPQPEENKPAVEESKEEAPAVKPEAEAPIVKPIEETQPQPEDNKPTVEDNKEEAPAVTPSEETQPQPEENKPTVEDNKEEAPAVTPSEEAQPQPEENKPAAEESKEETPVVEAPEEAKPQPEENKPQPEENKPAAEESKEETPVVEAPEEAQPKPEESKPAAEESKEETPAVTPSEEAQPQPEVEKTVVEETRIITSDESTIKETIVEDDSKYTDYRVVTEQGSPAEYTVVYRDGEEFSRTLSKEAVNRVIVVGTKAIDNTTVETITTAIPNKTIQKDDASLYVGETRVEVQGQPGEKTTTITKVYKKDELVDTKTVETVTTPAIDKLILVGTKPVITEERTTREESINFDTVYRDSNDHFEGDSIMQSPGRMGVVRITTITTKNKGVITNTREERTVVTPQENRIIIRGLKPLIKELRTTESETINPGATQTEYDNNAPEGSRIVKQKAEAGSITYEVIRRINQKTGSVVGEEKTIINRKDAKPEVIVIGTKKADVVTQPSTSTAANNYEGLDFNDNGTGFVPAFDEIYTMMGTRDRAALKQLAEEESWAMSLREMKDRFKFTTKEYGELYPEMSYEEESFYRFNTTNHSQAVMNSIRNNMIDEKLMKDEFLRLVNEARAQQGLAGLSYTEKGSLYDKANTQRAQEMAEHGSLRYLGAEEGKHKRPDGTRWTTVYSNQGIDVLDHFQYAGEVASEQSGHRYVANYLDEKAIAKVFFDSWMSSKGHRAVLMVNRDYPLTLAFDVRFGERTITYDHDNPIMVAMAQVFSVRP
ncbi:G5 domain-containing protein [Gemelliphila palaticanis]|uniref:G5 domain-containing protein n=1 Tax=Gemelliphila palaticanis TaxID=81950 RepID=A0ABX2T004_9BACL|nr:G5 domain-containing protein [Gemella palaticanis]MBF0715950.1 G5 domain-containing protein [Gemella palaticanis]NYS47880.1 G5 domain-containing protein [Gemella palaticanis]